MWNIPFFRTLLSQVCSSLSENLAFVQCLAEIGLDKDVIDSLNSEPCFYLRWAHSEILGLAGPYKRKPDCFRHAAGRIRVRCAEIDMDADQRVKGTHICPHICRSS